MLYSVLYKKKKVFICTFFKKKSFVEQYKYNGRNDIKLLRGANLMLLITVIFILVYILEAKYPVITGFLSQSVGIMQK